MRPALAAKAGSRGKIQQRWRQGRNASSLSQRHSVVPLICATNPCSTASRRNSASDQRANGRPRRDGHSHTSALISTLGGKMRRATAARLFFETGQPVGVKTLTPFADNLARCVQASANGVVRQSLAGQQYYLGPDHVSIG